MFFNRISASTLALLAGVALVSACNSPDGGSSVPTLGASFSVASHDFGNVNVGQSSELTLNLSNSGGQSIILGDVTTAGLGLGGMFAKTGGTCATGQALAVGATCTVQVAFSPIDPLLYTGTLALSVRASEGTATGRASVTLRGTGYLDCSATPALVQSYQSGVTEATARNQQEGASGTAAGQALTYEDGRQKGYADSYSSAYNEGYNRTYQPAYDAAYAIALNDGQADHASCVKGANDGFTRGDADGYADGSFTGYNDGYDFAYPTAHTDGYWDNYPIGYDDGAYACTGFRSAAKAAKPSATQASKPALPAALTSHEQVCHDRGYSATYNSQIYYTAYNSAVAANAAYQSGLVAGRSEGRSFGLTAGETDGYKIGTAQGDAAGFAAGQADAYDSCYIAAYDPAYDAAAIEGYNDNYDIGFVDGDTDGYAFGSADGYDAGYDDGYTDYCGPFLAGSSSKKAPSVTRRHDSVTRVYGRNQKWATKSGGTTVSTFVFSKARDAEASARQRSVLEDLSSRLKSYRGAQLRAKHVRK